jgi:hypothetical protein
VSARIVIYPRVNMGESRKLCLKPLLSRPIPLIVVTSSRRREGPAMGTLLIGIGILLFVVELAKIGAGQSGGFNNVLENFGINFGGSITQVNRQGNVSSTPANSKKDFDWSGVIIAALGVVSAVFG